jgi:hypothetical protein
MTLATMLLRIFQVKIVEPAFSCHEGRREECASAEHNQIKAAANRPHLPTHTEKKQQLSEMLLQRMALLLSSSSL